jgi:hypothetical protein
MTNYAIGIPGENPRMFITGSEEMAELQLKASEVFLEVSELSNGLIALDGESFELLGIDWDLEEIRIRSYRASLLSASDWTMAVDSPLSEQLKEEWATYRQTLRDIITAQPNTLFDDIVWPERP